MKDNEIIPKLIILAVVMIFLLGVQLGNVVTMAINDIDLTITQAIIKFLIMVVIWTIATISIQGINKRLDKLKRDRRKP